MRAALAPAVVVFSLAALASSPTSPQFDIWTVENGLPQNSVTSILAGARWVPVAHHVRWGSKQFSPVHGFEQLTVYAIAQDPDGDLWLGTSKGLFHYDGVHDPHAYTVADGLADNEIRSLRFDREGTLWIGTLAGLNRFLAGPERASQIDAVAEVPKTQIRTVYEDADGVLWIGTYDRGIGPSSPVRFSIACDSVDGLFEKDVEINLYRIVQESVNNVLKHSGASEAQVKVGRSTGQIAITIADNGKGFDVEATRSDPHVGSGLAGMVERARMIGGSVAISAAPGRGAAIVVTIPM